MAKDRLSPRDRLSRSDRKVRLPILGVDAEVTLPVAGGQAALTSLLPSARKLSATMMGLAQDELRKGGKRVSCRAGCSHCCRQLIPVSLVEARALMTALGKLPVAKQKAVRKRFEAALARLEDNGLVHPKGAAPRTALISPGEGDASDLWGQVNRAYYALHIDCPFLENDRCVAYEERPFACREYLVTSDPELCRDLDPRIEAVPRAAYTTRALTETVEELEGIRPGGIPLPLMLEWMEARGSELSSQHDPGAALEVLLEAMEWNVE
jgi:Fe-S-cluster containining protein